MKGTTIKYYLILYNNHTQGRRAAAPQGRRDMSTISISVKRRRSHLSHSQPHQCSAGPASSSSFRSPHRRCPRFGARPPSLGGTTPNSTVHKKRNDTIHRFISVLRSTCSVLQQLQHCVASNKHVRCLHLCHMRLFRRWKQAGITAIQ